MAEKWPLRMGLGLLLVSLSALGPASAQDSAPQDPGLDHAQEYKACMILTHETPQGALESARVWAKRGGGDAAEHCAAVALISLGQYEEAAERLEKLAAVMMPETDPTKSDLRPSLLAQAGQAWLMAEQAERAEAAQTAALKLDPDNVELLVDRGIARASRANYWTALDDLNRALDLAPERSDLLVLRASAYRYLNTLELAWADLDQAMKLDPDNAEGLLERGILRHLSGDTARARADWQRVIEIARETPAADAAHSNLEKLKTEAE